MKLIQYNNILNNKFRTNRNNRFKNNNNFKLSKMNKNKKK